MTAAAEDAKLAKAVRAFLDAHDTAHEATVDEIAEAVESDHATTARILDEYLVEDGKITHAGPGRGGGWISSPQA